MTFFRRNAAFWFVVPDPAVSGRTQKRWRTGDVENRWWRHLAATEESRYNEPRQSNLTGGWMLNHLEDSCDVWTVVTQEELRQGNTTCRASQLTSLANKTRRSNIWFENSLICLKRNLDFNTTRSRINCVKCGFVKPNFCFAVIYHLTECEIILLWSNSYSLLLEQSAFKCSLSPCSQPWGDTLQLHCSVQQRSIFSCDASWLFKLLT